MRGLFEVYLQQLRTTWAAMLQYRAALIIWLVSRVLEPVIYLSVWTAVSVSSGGLVGGYAAGDFAAYFILLMLCNHITFTWIMYEYEYRIREGLLSPALLRPIHPIHSDIADNVAAKLINLPEMLAIALLLALLFPPIFHPPLWAALLFAPALLLAFAIRFLLEWTLAQSAFWTTRVSAINQTYFAAALFLSGQIAPLSLFPAPLQAVASVLPFRWMIGFPVELLLGRLTPLEAMIGLAAQAAWLGGSLLILQLVWRAGLKIYSAVGA